VPWNISLRNLDDPVTANWVQNFLSGYTQGRVQATIDLRGTGGTKDLAVEQIASMFYRNGRLGCLTAGWRTDKICETLKGGSVIGSDHKRMTEPSARFSGTVVVVIDDQTRGTALFLAAVLQQHGAKIITSGAAVRHLPDLISKEALGGDPAARWIQYPDFHRSLANGATDFEANYVVPKGEEFNKIAQLYKLRFPPNDLHNND
jgi:hypothetical protein